MSAKPSVDISARLSAILSGIRKTRSSLYPADWTFDPLHKVEQELAGLLDDMKNPKEKGV